MTYKGLTIQWTIKDGRACYIIRDKHQNWLYDYGYFKTEKQAMEAIDSN